MRPTIVLQVLLAVLSPDGVPCSQSFAQTGQTEKHEISDQAWQAAGAITGCEAHICSLAFGPGAILVSSDAQYVRVWDVVTKQEHPFFKPPGKHAFTITAITFSSDDTWVSFRGLREYHLAFGEQWIKNGRPIDYGLGVRGESLWPLAIASDGKTYAIRSQFGKQNDVDIIRHEFGTRPATRQRPVLCRGHQGEADCAAFSPDLKLLATGSQDKMVRLWDTATGQQLAALTGHSDAVSVVEFSPNGAVIATGGKDGRIKFWDVATRMEKASMEGKTAVRCLSFSPNNKLLATGVLRILNVEDAKLSAIIPDQGGTIFSVAFNRQGNLLASGGQDKVIRLWKEVPK